MTSLDMKTLEVEHADICRPPQMEVAVVLEKALKENFASVSVRVVDCPDLTQPPFTLAAPGLCGSPRVVEVGGVPYLVPTAQKQKLYDLYAVPAACGLQQGMLIGAGAGPWPHVGVNSEMVPNISVSEAGRRNGSRVISCGEDGMRVAELPADEARCAILCNAFISEGKPGKVFEICCKQRTGEDNFIGCMRKALDQRYPDKTVAMGGVFLIESGRARVHVMPDFCSRPLTSDAEVASWLRFFEVSAPLVCCTSLLSSDPELDFRLEHTHCFSAHGEGGHYHCDSTPEEVSYRAYLQLAEHAYRIDAPPETHGIGRN